MAEIIDFPKLKEHAPYAQYQIVDVTFGEADTDLDIRHTLLPPTHEHVDYSILRQAQGAVVYHDMAATRKPWRDGIITLRSSVANARVTLQLSVSHEKRDLIQAGPTPVTPPVVGHNHDAADITTGALVKARQHAATAYTDGAVSFAGNMTSTGVTTGRITGTGSFSSYVADGLFGATASPSDIVTPGTRRLRLGYRDYGGGQYSARLGFDQSGAEVTTGAASFGMRQDGDLSVGPGNLDANDQMVFSANGTLNYPRHNVKFVIPGTDTLSTAAAAMANGDCLVLGAGTYTQTIAVSIPSTVTRFSIIGQGAGISILSYTNNTNGIGTVAADASRVTRGHLRGFSMVYNSAAANIGYAIYMWGCDYNSVDFPTIRIEDVSIYYGNNGICWDTGIFFNNAKNATIEKVFIRLTPSSRLGYGILLNSCMNVRINNSFIMSTHSAIRQAKAADADISGVTKHGCEDVQVSNCTIFICAFGVHLGELCTWCKVHQTEISRPSQYAIYELTTALGMHMIDKVWADNDGDHAASAAFIYLEKEGTTIQGCHFEDTGLRSVWGVLTYGTLTNITNSLFRQMGTGGRAGIFLGASHCKADGNVFMGTLAATADITINTALTGDMATNNLIDTSINDGSGVAVLANNPVH